MACIHSQIEQALPSTPLQVKKQTKRQLKPERQTSEERSCQYTSQTASAAGFFEAGPTTGSLPLAGCLCIRYRAAGPKPQLLVSNAQCRLCCDDPGRQLRPATIVRGPSKSAHCSGAIATAEDYGMLVSMTGLPFIYLHTPTNPIQQSKQASSQGGTRCGFFCFRACAIRFSVTCNRSIQVLNEGPALLRLSNSCRLAECISISWRLQDRNLTASASRTYRP